MTMRSGEMVFSGERGLVVSFWKDLKESGHFWLLHNVSNSLERSVLPSWIIAKGGKITHSKNGNWTALASQEPPKISVQGPPQRSCKDWATGPALCPGVTAPALEPSLDCNTPTEVATQSPGRWGDTNSTQNTSSPRSYALHFFNSCLHLDAQGTGGSFGGSAFSEKFVPTVVSWAAHGMNASQGSSTVCPWCQKGAGLQSHVQPKVERNNWDRSPVWLGPWALPVILGEKEQHWYLRRKEPVFPQVYPWSMTGSASGLRVSQLAPGQQQEGPRDTLDPWFFI